MSKSAKPVKRKTNSTSKKAAARAATVVAGVAALSALENEAEASQAPLGASKLPPENLPVAAQDLGLTASTSPDFQVDINAMLQTLEDMFAQANPSVDVEAIAEQIADAFPEAAAFAEQLPFEQLPFEMLLAEANPGTANDASKDDGDDKGAFWIPTEGLIAAGLIGIGAAAFSDHGGGGTN